VSRRGNRLLKTVRSKTRAGNGLNAAHAAARTGNLGVMKARASRGANVKRRTPHHNTDGTDGRLSANAIWTSSARSSTRVQHVDPGTAARHLPVAECGFRTAISRREVLGCAGANVKTTERTACIS